MGNLFSSDPPMFTIGIKTVKKSKLKTLKTYQDALRVMNLEVKDSDTVLVVQNSMRTLTPVHDKFQIVDGLVFKDRLIPIRRLYGRPSS
jgi:hypothetical protein